LLPGASRPSCTSDKPAVRRGTINAKRVVKIKIVVAKAIRPPRWVDDAATLTMPPPLRRPNNSFMTTTLNFGTATDSWVGSPRKRSKAAPLGGLFQSGSSRADGSYKKGRLGTYLGFESARGRKEQFLDPCSRNPPRFSRCFLAPVQSVLVAPFKKPSDPFRGRGGQKGPVPGVGTGPFPLHL
jgi:hypothetical protein